MEKTEMTLDEAIEHIRLYSFDTENLSCAREHGQLADWLEELKTARAKATAYDRLMSGGKKTLKEWANLLGRPVAMDFGGVVESYNTIPMRCDSAGYWYCDDYSENFEDEHFIIPKECFDYTGSWQDSLTLPDGWEEK